MRYAPFFNLRKSVSWYPIQVKRGAPHAHSSGSLPAKHKALSSHERSGALSRPGSVARHHPLHLQENKQRCAHDVLIGEKFVPVCGRRRSHPSIDIIAVSGSILDDDCSSRSVATVHEARGEVSAAASGGRPGFERDAMDRSKQGRPVIRLGALQSRPGIHGAVCGLPWATPGRTSAGGAAIGNRPWLVRNSIM
jgi:hypothetical protein